MAATRQHDEATKWLEEAKTKLAAVARWNDEPKLVCAKRHVNLLTKRVEKRKLRKDMAKMEWEEEEQALENPKTDA